MKLKNQMGTPKGIKNRRCGKYFLVAFFLSFYKVIFWFLVFFFWRGGEGEKQREARSCVSGGPAMRGYTPSAEPNSISRP